VLGITQELSMLTEPASTDPYADRDARQAITARGV